MEQAALPDLDEIEARLRSLTVREEILEPDEIRKDWRTGELTFLWHERRVAIVVGPDGEPRDVPLESVSDA